MKIPKHDLQRLRIPAIIFVVLVALGAATVWASLGLLKTAEREHREVAAKRAEMQGRLARARDEEQELRAKITRYQEISGKGYIGAERRLDWIESLARIKATHRLLDLQYEFSAQRPADATVVPGGPAAGNYDIVASQMRIDIPLLHEGDLLAFLGDLRKTAPALIQIRSCEINRIPRSESDRGQRALLNAKCVLEWITLKERK